MWTIEAPGPLDPVAGDELAERLLGEAAEALFAEPEVRALTVLTHDTVAAEAPSPSPSPDGTSLPLAVVSAWVGSYQRRGEAEAIVQSAASDLAVSAYLVVESLVEDYGTTPHAAPRDWPDGERSPGVVTVALLHRPEGVDEATWLHAWHEVQSPRSGVLQPRCRYVRNRVVQVLTPGAEAIDGIVEEAWASPAVVADPMQFFATGGDPEKLGPMVTEMLENVQAALDLSRLRSVTMGEHLLRSL